MLYFRRIFIFFVLILISFRGYGDETKLSDELFFLKGFDEAEDLSQASRLVEILRTEIGEKEKIKLLREYLPRTAGPISLANLYADIHLEVAELSEETKNEIRSMVLERVQKATGGMDREQSERFKNEFVGNQIVEGFAVNLSDDDFKKSTKALQSAGLIKEKFEPGFFKSNDYACSVIERVGINFKYSGDEGETIEKGYLLRSLTRFNDVFPGSGSLVCLTDDNNEEDMKITDQYVDKIVAEMIRKKIDSLEKKPSPGSEKELKKLLELRDKIRGVELDHPTRAVIGESDYSLQISGKWARVKVLPSTDCLLPDVEKYLCGNVATWSFNKVTCHLHDDVSSGLGTSHLIGELIKTNSGSRHECSLYLSVQSSPISSFKKPESSEVKCSGATKLYRLSHQIKLEK